MNQRTAWQVALVLLLCDCGIQATGGAAGVAHQHPVAAGIGLMTHVPRVDTAMLGLRLGGAIDHGFALRHALMHAGADLRVWPGRVVFEPGVDLGVGKPLEGDYHALGAYAGLAASLRIRLLGADDAQTAFNLIAVSTELVIAARGGAWMPAEGEAGAALRGEYALEVGVRLTASTDLFAPTRGHIDASPGADPHAQVRP